jgi:2-dehydro-3-deoxyphosphooctonate aldolase (KDO 8-P synthase)
LHSQIQKIMSATTHLKSIFKDQYNHEALLMHVAEKVSGICKRLNIPYIFKASYRKANRTSITSFSGVGDVEGLDLLQKTGETFNLPVTTDIHSAAEAAMAAAYVDKERPVRKW